jgi:hypothetical protein
VSIKLELLAVPRRHGVQCFHQFYHRRAIPLAFELHQRFDQPASAIVSPHGKSVWELAIVFLLILSKKMWVGRIVNRWLIG